MIVVSLKYVVLIMRRRQPRRGRHHALIALAQKAIKGHQEWRIPLLLIGVFGASLFYGDAVLTRQSRFFRGRGARGRHARTQAYVVPVAVCVLLGLFTFQARGTAAVGKLFGPVTMACSSPSARRASTASRRRRRSSPRSIRCTGSSFSRATAAPRSWCLGSVVLAGYRCGGALCGHGALRQRRGARGLVQPRGPGARAQLFRPRRAAHGAAAGGGETRSICSSRGGRFSPWSPWRRRPRSSPLRR